MGALLARFRAIGITFKALPGGRLNAVGPLDDQARTAIREHKAAILVELETANDAAIPEQVAELRGLIGLLFGGDTDAHHADALAAALADPDGALMSFRALAANRI